MSNSITGQSQVVRISDVELATDGTETLGTKHGVTLGATSTVYMGQDLTAFGAWMAHSEFSVPTANQTVGGILTGARPAGRQRDLARPHGGTARRRGETRRFPCNSVVSIGRARMPT